MRRIDVSTSRLPNTFAMVDDEDFDSLSKYKWRAKENCRTFYADRPTKPSKKQGKVRKQSKVQMHRSILSAPRGMEVDHIDGDGLNNQKSNLRLCTKSQNQHNRRPQCNKSGFKGVVWHKRNKRWQSQLMLEGRYVYLGTYFCLIKAAKAYDEGANKHFGKFARLNFPDKA